MSEIYKNTESIEQKKEVFWGWINDISINHRVTEIPKETVKDVLEEFGASFEISEKERESLRGYSENERALGMHAVWGEKFDKYKIWIRKEYIPNYEERTGKELPMLIRQKNSTSDKAPTGRKNSGMIQFLGELTSYATGEVDSKTFQMYLEARVKNGWLWEEGRSKEGLRIKVPTSKNPIRPASIPPEFPVKAIEFLSN